jgi:hypothetical protein
MPTSDQAPIPTYWNVKIPRRKTNGNANQSGRRDRPRHPILDIVWREAKKRSGRNNQQLARAIGAHLDTSLQRENLSYEKFIRLCVYAGIPKPIATTLFGKMAVPDEDAHYIGCTVPGGRRKGPWKAQLNEWYKVIELLIAYAGNGNGTHIPDNARAYGGFRLTGGK